MSKTGPFFLAGLLLLSAATATARGGNPPYATPIFYPFSEPTASGYSDYRPVLNADATMVIFERTFTDNPNVTQLYAADLATNVVQGFVNIEAARADWCWNRSNGRPLAIGPVAFSNGNGIFVVDGTILTLLPNTGGMVYPSWYPDCRSLAVDVSENTQLPGEHVTARINAVSGEVIAAPLANDSVWAGFPSVNQVDPRLISFAGQFKRKSNYYNELLNYTWVTNRSTNPPRVAPMDREAPTGPGFLQEFQARAGWWSPDGKWFAFESNRVCDDLDGLTYAIFIQDAEGAKPAMQVTSCDWNANHPKWFPPGSTGNKTLLIAVFAQPRSQGQSAPYHIATLDVTGFVHRH
jgi:WD40-like Beta Propeller Repeat